MTGRRRVWVLGIALLLAGSGSSAVLSSAASQTPTASTRGPAGLSDLPANMFVALELPGLGQGIPGHGMKHVTWAYNPINKQPKIAVKMVAVVLGPIGRPANWRMAGLTTMM